MKDTDELYSDIELSTYGENPGDIDSLALEDKLSWETECKRALIESQVRLANRVRELERALQDVINFFQSEQDSSALSVARNVLTDRTWTKKSTL